MTLRVIGAGVGRTGTLSLKLALERLLGARCYHMTEVFQHPVHFASWTAASRGEHVAWPALFEGFGATVDWPAAAFWKELSRAYPDAIILLSTRDAAAWWKSCASTIFARRDQPPPPPMAEMTQALFGNRFTSAIHDRDAAIAAYERHNADVRATAPRDRLVEWTPGAGWGPLCDALHLPVPSEPFPHVNTTEEFNARIASGLPIAPH